jgi:hypothetical protein
VFVVTVWALYAFFLGCVHTAPGLGLWLRSMYRFSDWYAELDAATRPAAAADAPDRRGLVLLDGEIAP